MPIELRVDDERQLTYMNVTVAVKLLDLVQVTLEREEKAPHAAEYDVIFTIDKDAKKLPLIQKYAMNAYLAKAWKKYGKARCAIVSESLSHLVSAEMITKQKEVSSSKYAFFETEEEALAWLGK